ncbi:MAG: SIMPL domain-containing protein [Cyclobacteriaceae bacterium]|nr:SIMPL domain-containing protein [Cyclobacteriaceae bacterium]
MEKSNNYLLPAAIIIGAAIGAFFLGQSIERFNREDRTISVKGFSEQEVKSDLAVWALKVSVPTNDLSAGSSEIENSKNKIIAFLTRNGIAADEIIQKEMQVADRKANEYNPDMNISFRYIITKTILVRSANVDVVFKVSQMTDELVRAGVVMSSQTDWQNNGVSFMYTGLNSIKPTMLAEATRNARQAAEEFCRESGTDLGKLKRATQGLFTIVDRDDVNASQNDGGYYSSGRRDVFKKVRVVVSVEYSIE